MNDPEDTIPPTVTIMKNAKGAIDKILALGGARIGGGSRSQCRRAIFGVNVFIKVEDGVIYLVLWWPLLAPSYPSVIRARIASPAFPVIIV